MPPSLSLLFTHFLCALTNILVHTFRYFSLPTSLSLSLYLYSFLLYCLNQCYLCFNLAFLFSTSLFSLDLTVFALRASIDWVHLRFSVLSFHRFRLILANFASVAADSYIYWLFSINELACLALSAYFRHASLSDLRMNLLFPPYYFSYLLFCANAPENGSIVFFFAVISVCVVNLEAILREVTCDFNYYLSDLVNLLAAINLCVQCQTEAHDCLEVRIWLTVPLWFFSFFSLLTRPI